MQLEVTEREFHTILASLRFWEAFVTKHPEGDQGWFDDIASNGGEIDPLGADEIDALCLRLNTGSGKN